MAILHLCFGTEKNRRLGSKKARYNRAFRKRHLFCLHIMVEVTGLEPAASCSQSRRATTCATPRYFYINFFLISLFPSLLCPPSCGSRNLFGSIVSLDIPTAAPKNARFFCHRQRSRFCPKQARYHLRYTSIFLYQLFSYISVFFPALSALLRFP